MVWHAEQPPPPVNKSRPAVTRSSIGAAPVVRVAVASDGRVGTVVAAAGEVNVGRAGVDVGALELLQARMGITKKSTPRTSAPFVIFNG